VIRISGPDTSQNDLPTFDPLTSNRTGNHAWIAMQPCAGQASS
jgi:hypothetical protein